jgi:hypothetical protein
VCMCEKKNWQIFDFLMNLIVPYIINVKISIHICTSVV